MVTVNWIKTLLGGPTIWKQAKILNDRGPGSAKAFAELCASFHSSEEVACAVYTILAKRTTVPSPAILPSDSLKSFFGYDDDDLLDDIRAVIDGLRIDSAGDHSHLSSQRLRTVQDLVSAVEKSFRARATTGS
jgi:hypothetical protein